MTTDSELEPSFTIGAVSRLTGVPVDTLRVWERRYSGMTPARTTTNRRRYTQEDITRLTLIKQLVDQGHSVGTVVHLAEPALRERLRLHGALPALPPRVEGKISVVVYGESLPFLVEDMARDFACMEVLESHSIYAEFERTVLEQKPAVLVAEWPTLSPEGLRRLHELAQRTAAQRAVAVYGFGMRDVLDQARQLGIATLRAPVTAAMLETACLGGGPVSGAEPVPGAAEISPRRFDSEALGKLATIATRLRCECPHHLADLIFRLSAFEAYSLDCANRNEQDAALHAHLHRATAEARALIESALAHLVEVEAIDLAGIQPS